MSDSFLLYGVSGYVGEGAARQTVRAGLRPVLAGRNEKRVRALAAELGCEWRAFALDDPSAIDRGIEGMTLVLHLAGPFVYTARQMVEACLRRRVHYLDINGEIPVLEDLAGRDADARRAGIMIMPAVGFDVVPTDCLAVYLHRNLPTATRLTIAFHAEDGGKAPPGTQRTAIELARLGLLVRRDGRLVHPTDPNSTRNVVFPDGPRKVYRLTWGDLVTAFRSTGIPNIEVFAAASPAIRRQMAALVMVRPLLKLAPVRRLLALAARPGPSAEERARTVTHIWAEVVDDSGNRASARLRGPDAGHDWTIAAALSVVRRVLAGDAPPGFQTPAGAYGPDLVLDVEGVTRESGDRGIG
jgi:short subunit dehydrogenase-like uncharacterized protein